MTVIKTTALALMTLLTSATAAAGHHEKGEGPELAAKPGYPQTYMPYGIPSAMAVVNALKAAGAQRNATMEFVEAAGHSDGEPPIARALRHATDMLARESTG